MKAAKEHKPKLSRVIQNKKSRADIYSSNVVQRIDIANLGRVGMSQLVDDYQIDRGNSAIAFVKVGSGFGHARLLLEQVDNNRYRNFLIELDANASSGKDSDKSWMSSVISSGRSFDDSGTSSSKRKASGNHAAGSEVSIIIKYLPNISTRNLVYNPMRITNAQGNAVLCAAELLRQNEDILDYRAIITDTDSFKMNCASFVELICNSAGINVDSSFLGMKTPGGLL